MRAGRRAAAVWAGLCLAGLGATAALNIGSDTARPSTGGPDSEGLTVEINGTEVGTCARIIQAFEEARAGALPPSEAAPNAKGSGSAQAVVTQVYSWDAAVPSECEKELKARGLTQD
ncbi:hypothetical protein AAHZ94_05570 [Streptomyces sp. HSW2009]|uniref:hypothetical protein n=1 Tax=Streptomyces sp. HSW2009 TaxID=3142890 RepID=UPI0032EB3DF9